MSKEGDTTVKGFLRDFLNRKYLDFFRSNTRTFEFFRNIIRARYKSYFGIAILQALIASAIAVSVPYLTKLETDQLVEKNSHLFQFVHATPYGIFLIILVVILLANLLESFIRMAFDRFTRIDKMRLDNDISSGIYEKFLLIEPGFSLSKRNERLMRELRSSGPGIPSKVESFISSLVTQAFTIGSILTILGLVDWRIFPGIVISVLIGAKINRMQEAYRIRHDLRAGYTLDHELSEVQNTLESDYVQIRINGGEHALLARMQKALQQNIELERKNMLQHMVYSILNTLNSEVSGALVKGIIGYAIFWWTGSVGLMAMSIMYVGRIEDFFSYLARLVPDIRYFSDSVRKFEIFLAVSEHGKKLNQAPFEENIETVRIENLTFRYPKMVEEELQFIDIAIQRLRQYGSKSDDYEMDELHMLENLQKEAAHPSPIVLQNVSTEFHKGKIYGIVGKNGAGKTTFVHQMLGFFTQYEGSLRFNDTEVRGILGTSLGQMASIVSQDPFLLDGIFTIRENLLFGVTKETSDETLWQLLEEFDLAKKIRSFRLGLDTPLGWDIDLSGGQRQLIVIIRVILQDRQLLILDEGTSQLDAENELRVMKRLVEWKSNKIIIFITHRLSTIRKADTILCIEKGKISDIGSHSELLSRDSLYKKLYEMQMSEKFENGV